MLTLKKYANGQFFDTVNKKYIKVAVLKKMVQKGEKIKVTMSKTGKDITKSVLDQFSKKEGITQKVKSAGKTLGKTIKKSKKATTKKAKTNFIKTDSIKKWAGEFIDNRIAQVFDAIKLPSRKQIEELDANIKALNEKIERLEALQDKKASKAKTSKKAAPSADAKAGEAKLSETDKS